MEDLILIDDGWRGRVAFIKNNVVVDIFENSPTVQDGVPSNTAEIGDVYKDGEFSKPEPLPPLEETPPA